MKSMSFELQRCRLWPKSVFYDRFSPVGVSNLETSNDQAYRFFSASLISEKCHLQTKPKRFYLFMIQLSPLNLTKLLKSYLS